MKKFLVVLITLLFAAGAFAQDAAKVESKGPEFKYGFYGIAYGVKGQSGATEWDYAHVRVKPSFTMGNENVKGVVIFEIDQDMGANAKGFDGAARSSADNGTDNKDVEVKHAYVEVKDVLIPGFTLMAGLNAFYMPLVADNDFGMASAAYDFGMGKAVFSYLKHQEYSPMTQMDDESDDDGDGRKVEVNRDDVESYAIQIPVKAGFITINPGFMYTSIGKEHADFTGATATETYLYGVAAATVDTNGNTVIDSAENQTAYFDGSIKNYSLNIAGEIDMFSFDASYTQANGKVHVDYENASQGTDRKLRLNSKAYDVFAAVKPVDMFKLGLFYTAYSGDSRTADNRKNDHIAIMDQYYGAPDGRLFLLDAGGTTALGGNTPFDNGDYTKGLEMYGVNAEIAPIQKLTILAQYAYVKSKKDIKYTTILGTEKKTKNFAQEIDFSATLEVAPKTSLFVECAYVMFNKDFKDDINNDTEQSSAKEVVFGMLAKI